MAQLKIALEWFLNPDHLPLLAAQEASEDEIELIVPDDHYDGFAALAAGEVDIVVNEPLHLLEKHSAAMQSHGCFFETDGGVLLRDDVLSRLAQGESVKICSPVSNEVTDELCRRIVMVWAYQQGVDVQKEQIQVLEKGFDHITNLQNGADGAWLAFANIEGVMVKELGMPIIMVTTKDAGIPGFSALELIGQAQAAPEKQAAIARLVTHMQEAVKTWQSHPEQALALWNRHNPEPQADAALTAAIVTDTLCRFETEIAPSAQRWLSVWAYMQGLQVDIIDEEAYHALFPSLEEAS
ncbi:hypothetical protein ADP71_24730 [Vitreoscilla sp. C1]|uniref:ABC transporter substrate-binding protein n=1 Tax=Vitreoscilla sp. (strain C1) TaxID=96942 RepID=UPI00131A3FD5|nr:ABC transporter substrate-binding protein [Vitreoscilla sp. C1]AUZ05808.2 hypothetical protein ADP71_24730 [Vitreoscilla sp. C1]